MNNTKLPPIKRGICSKCDKPIVADQLFIDENLCGYQSEDHGCGKEYTMITFIDRDLVKYLKKGLKL